ncbi:MAG: TetR/AcrR family transcriptional regulator [Nocardioidaceae bacterium]|nr:TetR/AcrR family transcriptional regulator [Nocardioidaceae bacterium]NUS53211.1 TetR/AcrR family transcriptional regulator [Nocardioidaceae bacterium]
MAPGPRPRVEGEREEQILDSTLVLLERVGYDRLTMDAVATEAKASKATLYRRWSSKSSLVVDAILRTKEALQVPEVDTGSLRDDLIQMACGHGGLSDSRSTHLMAGLVTALHHDPEFAEEFRTRVLGPKIQATRTVFERARARGEITGDLDLDLLAPALAGIILHRSFVLGLPADDKTVTRVVDEIILPAATRPSP